MNPIVLASSSPYRRALLEKLGLPFSAASPDIDETPHAGETATALVERLARAKAAALADAFPRHLIIGSDQVACLGGDILGKPGTLENARRQLRAASGRRVEFLTGLCVLDSASGVAHSVVESFSVVFRPLGDTAIDHYLERERPFDCAGSFKSEGLGIALFEKLDGNDPNALVGLPLIRLVDLLSRFGVAVL